jgi:hypothetical protein
MKFVDVAERKLFDRKLPRWIDNWFTVWLLFSLAVVVPVTLISLLIVEVSR